MNISSEDRRRVEDAIQRAERRSGADFVCVLLHRAGTYEAHALVWGSVLALAAPWVLLWLTAWPFADILLVQLGLFALAVLAFGTPPMRRLLVPRRLQRATAHRAAAEQFLIRDLASTPSRRAILLFVADDERYARVLADDGAVRSVPDDHWRRAVDLLIAGAKQGRHAAGFIEALEFCADALSGSAPAGSDEARTGALPNRFVVID